MNYKMTYPKNTMLYWALCFFIIMGCTSYDYCAQYTIQAIGIDSMMTLSTGQITLDVHRNGSWSTGVISVETDSLHIKDSIICSNRSKSGTPFFDAVLVKSGHRLIMYDDVWGLFKKGGRQVVFFKSVPKSNLMFNQLNF